jgi:uncharacterized OB-fold protein
MPANLRNRVTVTVCTACGYCVFPRRLLCPQCGSGGFRAESARWGIVEEATTNRAGEPIGSVRTDAGPVVLARLGPLVTAGANVQLAYENGVSALLRVEVNSD